MASRLIQSSPRSQAEMLLRQALEDPRAEFREGQWESIRALVVHRDRLLVVHRTGWGKSMVYFIATALQRRKQFGLTLLVSPLLALMRNQIAAARRLGLRAATINSANFNDWEDVEQRLRSDEIDLLLISPERFASDGFRERVLEAIAARIGLFVVDEAHCISDWGHDFRPDYRRLVRILRLLPPTVPVLATTATANHRVVADIRAQLGDRLIVELGSLDRESLVLQTLSLPDPAARLAWLAEHVPRMPGSGILYTLTVRDSQQVAGWLKSRGIECAAYYGELDSAERERLEQALLANRLKAMVATTALGLGFDKPDLGFVIHYQRPQSVIHYYQQVGRAGRAIPRAYGVLLCGAEDDEIADYFLRTALPPEAHVQAVLDILLGASDGANLADLERRLNLSRGQIQKVLDDLSVADPSPLTKVDHRWYLTRGNYAWDAERYRQLGHLRRYEQARMHAYRLTTQCLMQFLRDELDDRDAPRCGRCANCDRAAALPTGYSTSLAHEAQRYLRKADEPIAARKLWPSPSPFAARGWSGRIAADLQSATGRAMCRWGDAGYGQIVERGKHAGSLLNAELVNGAAELIRERWQPTPAPGWITSVPSQRHPRLVPEFAEALSAVLELPYVAVVQKARERDSQKLMNNSFQQARNLSDVFMVDSSLIRPEPVLLIDDTVDSGWTFTVVAALLRAAGVRCVHPLALARTTTK